jgi:class 3 adenylate cyclase/pimeloyl-ACP methyl ester carboxylesterase
MLWAWPCPLSNVEKAWSLASVRAELEEMSRHFTLYAFDWRNTGSSTRGAAFGFEEWRHDVEAVFGVIPAGPVAVFNGDHSGVLLRFIAENPGRVGRLATWNLTRRPEDNPEVAAVVPILRLDRNWVQLYARKLARGSSESHQDEFLEYFDSCSSPKYVADVFALTSTVDVTSSLGRISVPSLVVHRRGLGAAAGADFAAHLPDGLLFIVEGDSQLFAGDVEDPLPAVLAFLAQAPQQGADARQTAGSSPFRTLLFTDLVDHSAMMSRLGDLKGREVLREHERVTRECLAAHGGHEVKSMGDGFMASFGSAQKAIECAVALQQAMGALRTPHFAPGEGLKVRAGINAGEPIAEDDDLFGASVIAAARIAAKAQGGQVLVSDVVRQLVTGKGFLFSNTGEHDLKGLEEPVRLWELRWEA